MLFRSCDKSDKALHDMMKSIAYSSDVSEVSFPGDSYHLASASWVKNHYRNTPEVWDAAQDSYRELIESNALRIPVLDKYRYYVPEISIDPEKTLRGITEAVIRDLGLGMEYTGRLNYELGVIEGLGMSDYFLLVHDYVNWCHRQGIFVMEIGRAHV